MQCAGKMWPDRLYVLRVRYGVAAAVRHRRAGRTVCFGLPTEPKVHPPFEAATDATVEGAIAFGRKGVMRSVA